MKNVKFLFALAGIFYLTFLFISCEDETADPPIDGVTAMKQNTGNPAVWSADIDISQLKMDFKKGMTPQLLVPINNPFNSCFQIFEDKKDCILAATGNWENIGVSDNPLGDSICCEEYYKKLLADNGCMAIILPDKSNILNPVSTTIREELLSADNGKKNPINIDFSNYPKAVENVNIGFLVQENKHYLATSFLEKNGKGTAVQKTLLQNLNAEKSETFVIEQAKFIASNAGGSGPGNLTFGAGISMYLPYKDTPIIIDDETVANCGGQGTDKPRIKNKSAQLSTGGGGCASCKPSLFCIKETNRIEAEIFMHIGHPIKSPNAYHGKKIITKTYHLINNVSNSHIDDSKIDKNQFSALITNISPLPGNDTILIDSSLFKPYLKFDSLVMACPQELEIKVNRFIIPLKFTLPTNFMNSPNDIILVVAQIVEDTTGSPLFAMKSDTSQSPEHSNVPEYLENEIFVAFSTIKENQIDVDGYLVDNIFICP